MRSYHQRRPSSNRARTPRRRGTFGMGILPEESFAAPRPTFDPATRTVFPPIGADGLPIGPVTSTATVRAWNEWVEHARTPAS